MKKINRYDIILIMILNILYDVFKANEIKRLLLNKIKKRLQKYKSLGGKYAGG